MTFINFDYSGDRWFPISESDDNFSFRAWVNVSTSIDRVFTVSRDSESRYQGNLLEIRSKTGRKRKGSTNKFKEFDIVPKCGFRDFIKKVDSLNLMSIKSQPFTSFELPYDTPFSLFVIEIKERGKYNCFQFRSHYPYKDTIASKYQRIQDLIFKELPFKIYVNK